MDKYLLNEILQFLKDKTPMIYDMESEDLKYDKNSMYYKIYKYIHELREENRKLRERK
jgi:hypothetical protein